MQKLALAIGLLLLSSFSSATASQRVVLAEEFTGTW
jgi:hypothetical protein